LKPRLRVFVLAPTAAVALYCLLGDAGIGTFVKKVGATYLFFFVLAVVLGLLWDAAAPGRPDEPSREPKRGGRMPEPEPGARGERPPAGAAKPPREPAVEETPAG
jgi:hypothetical protein